MTDRRTRTLIVEDEFLIAQSLKTQLEALGCEVCGVADSADKAVELAIKHDPGIIMMDVRLSGDGDGVDAARAINKLMSSQIIFVTGSREPATINRIAAEGHAVATLFKPVPFLQLQRTIQAVLN
jgi:two-component system, response regulator PdtaR